MKDFFITVFYIFGAIGIFDIMSHSVNGPCVNPLMYIVKGITNESK